LVFLICYGTLRALHSFPTRRSSDLDEDAQGLPFVGKAGQLLNNMITAMGLQREEVYIANIVKCRPPGNRVPEPVEANTCSPFLRSEEHTSELQSRGHLVCRLLLEKK